MNESRNQTGSVVIELLAALALVIPLLYLAVALSRVGAAQFAAEVGAREAVRAMMGASSSIEGQRLTTTAVALALSDQGFILDEDTVSLDCSADPCLTPDEWITAQVRVAVPLPGAPGLPPLVTVESFHSGRVPHFTPTR